MRLPLHPHNLGLQIWLELGAVGAYLIAMVAAAAAWTCAVTKRASRFANAATAATATALFLISSLSFGAWQDWWTAVSALAFVLVLFVRRLPANAGAAA